MLVNIPVPWMVWVMYLIRRVTIRAFSSYSGYDQTQLSPEFLASNCADKLRYYVAMEGQSWGRWQVTMADVIMPFCSQICFLNLQYTLDIFIEGLPPMPPTPNRGDSKVGCGRSKQWFGDGWQVSGILQPFCVDAHRSQKTAETLLLEPTKNKEKKSPQAKQTFAQRKTWKPASHQAKLKKKVFGTRMRKGRTPAGFVPKPLRNRSRKNAETSLLEPIKKRKK